MLKRRAALPLLSLVPLLGLMACGGDEAPTETPTPTAPPAAEAAPISLPLHPLDIDTVAEGGPVDLQMLRLEGPDAPEVGDVWHLKASAVDLGGGPLTYAWSASSGTLSAEEGEEITWTATSALARVALTLTAVDGAGRRAEAQVAFRTTAPGAPSGIEARDDIGYFCSVQVGSDLKPEMVAFNNTRQSLHHYAWDGASWAESLIDGPGLDVGGQAGYHAVFRLDAAGTPHVLYGHRYFDAVSGSTEYGLTYATQVEGRWRLVELGTYLEVNAKALHAELHPSTGKPVVVFRAIEPNASVGLMVCTGDCLSPEGWEFQEIYRETRSSVGSESYNGAYPGGMAFEADGTLHVGVVGRFYSYEEAGPRTQVLDVSGSGDSFEVSEPIESYTTSYQYDHHEQNMPELALDAQERLLMMTQAGIWHAQPDGGWTLSEYQTSTASDDGATRFRILTEPSVTPPAMGRVMFTYAYDNTLEFVETDDRGYFTYTYLGAIENGTYTRADLTLDGDGSPHLCWTSNDNLMYTQLQ